MKKTVVCRNRGGTAAAVTTATNTTAVAAIITDPIVGELQGELDERVRADTTFLHYSFTKSSDRLKCG